MAVQTKQSDILAEQNRDNREHIIQLLTKAYWMEIETVVNYVANSTNPDGVRAQEIIESLAEDVQEELGHARKFATRIKELYGVVPGSLGFSPEQHSLHRRAADRHRARDQRRDRRRALGDPVL